LQKIYPRLTRQMNLLAIGAVYQATAAELRMLFLRHIMVNSMIELVEKSKDAKYLKTKTGLQAIKKPERAKINCKEVKLTGSVDIDGCLVNRYPDANRWDYAVGYVGDEGVIKVAFVEIHPAQTSEVAAVINKAQWLKTWGEKKAKELWNARKGLYWITSGKFNILPHSNYNKRLAQWGLSLPIRSITLK